MKTKSGEKIKLTSLEELLGVPGGSLTGDPVQHDHIRTELLFFCPELFIQDRIDDPVDDPSSFKIDLPLLVQDPFFMGCDAFLRFDSEKVIE